MSEEVRITCWQLSIQLPKIKQFEFHCGISATACNYQLILIPPAFPTSVLMKQTNLVSNAQSDDIMKKCISLKEEIFK
jgi:hypothetical protein